MKNGRPAILGTYLLFSLFFFTFSFFLQAQDSSDGETYLIQRLTWTGDEYARRYEVVIEKEDQGEYRELLREFTTALFIEVPILPGKYRCMVITYDFLNMVGEASEWKYIEVLALDPESVYQIDDIEMVQKTDDVKPFQFSKKQKKFDMFLGAAWMPSFAVSDKGDRFGRNISLAGFAARFAIASNKPNYFNPGLELAASYNKQGVTHLLAFGLNLSAQKWFPGDKTALTFRLGAGYSTFLPDDKAVYTNMGISFLLFVMNSLCMETGLDYTHWFKSPPASCFRPWVGVGWRF